jgi:hypothetical protein
MNNELIPDLLEEEVRVPFISLDVLGSFVALLDITRLY